LCIIGRRKPVDLNVVTVVLKSMVLKHTDQDCPCFPFRRTTNSQTSTEETRSTQGKSTKTTKKSNKKEANTTLIHGQCMVPQVILLHWLLKMVCPVGKRRRRSWKDWKKNNNGQVVVNKEELYFYLLLPEVGKVQLYVPLGGKVILLTRELWHFSTTRLA